MQPRVRLGAWDRRCAVAGWAPAAAAGRQGDLLHVLLVPCLGPQGRLGDGSLGHFEWRRLRGGRPGQPLLHVEGARWTHALPGHLPSLPPWRLVAG